METETVQHIICCCEALAWERYNVFGKLFAEPKDISTASVRGLCLVIRGIGLLNLCWTECLGLHDKPKAEVHLEHLLMGPEEEAHHTWDMWCHVSTTLCTSHTGLHSNPKDTNKVMTKQYIPPHAEKRTPLMSCASHNAQAPNLVWHDNAICRKNITAAFRSITSMV
jgi:hypothetical protein